MHTIRPRRVAALLAVLALLFAAIPTAAAAAAPRQTEQPVANEPGVRVPLVHALAAWFAGLWPGSDPPTAPQSVWEEIGPDLDPGGTPQPESGIPTPTPQIGPDLDPNG